MAFASIVIPILEECQHLKEIELQHMTVPRDFITRIFKAAKESIFIYLNPRISVDSRGTFEEITNGVKNSPYLIDLTLPWPHGPEKLSRNDHVQNELLLPSSIFTQQSTDGNSGCI